VILSKSNSLPTGQVQAYPPAVLLQLSLQGTSLSWHSFISIITRKYM